MSQEAGVVQSVERTFKIIEILSQNPKGMGLLAVSNSAELHKSTTHRLLSCLIQMGYVFQDEGSGIYRLTLKLFEISSRLVNSTDLLSGAKPHLDRLSQLVEEAVHLVVPSGTNIVYIYKVDEFNPSNVRMASRVGLNIPMYCTGCGKTILAYLSDAERLRIWEKSDVKKLTANTITDFTNLCSQLEEIKRLGYGFDNEENEIGVRCVAFPILDRDLRPIAAFSVSAPISRMSDGRIAEILPHALDALRQISLELGGYVGASPQNPIGAFSP